MHKLDLEPTVLAPKTAQTPSYEANQLKDKLPVKWTVAASVAAVMVVGWMALQQQVQPGATPGANLEMANAEVNEQAIPAEYLSAHRSSAPSTSSYYIQSVNYAE
jgi:sigma-E factor negative regulatory protein RseA